MCAKGPSAAIARVGGAMKGRIISLFVTRGGIVGVNFLSLLVVAALMAPAEFGAFVFLWSASQMLSAVAAFGGANYLIREGSARQGDPSLGVTRKEAVLIAFGYPALILAVIAIAATALSALFAEIPTVAAIKLADVFAVCLAAGAMIALSHSATPLRLDEKQTLSMMIRDAGPSSLMVSAFLISYAAGTPDPRTILMCFAAMAAGTAFVFFFYIRIAKVALWRQGPRADRRHRERELRVFWGSDIAGMALTQFDILIGAAFVTNTELGHYQILKRLANLVGLPLVVTNWSAQVSLGKLHASKKIEEMQKICADSSIWSFLPGIALLLALLPMLFVLLPLYKMELSWLYLATFLIIGAANLTNLAFGVAITFAVMTGSEKAALNGRILGCVAGAAMIPIATLISPTVGLAFSLLIATITLNGFIARQIFNRVGIRTDIGFAVQKMSRKYR